VIGDAAEDHEKGAGAGREIKNADREDEAAPSDRERLRQKAILGHSAT
jgi:hypothetical protein